MAEYTESCVYLTDKIRRWIRSELSSEFMSPENKKQLSRYTETTKGDQGTNPDIIPFRLVKALHKCLQEEQASLYLHELLEGSDVVLPKVKPTPRNPELEARIEKLKLQQENKDYQQMTRNVNLTQIKNDALVGSIGKEVKSMNKQLMGVLNFVLTVIGAFAFGYKAVEYSLEVPSVPAQMMSGLIFATVVFFADLYFLIKYDV